MRGKLYAKVNGKYFELNKISFGAKIQEIEKIVEGGIKDGDSLKFEFEKFDCDIIINLKTKFNENNKPTLCGSSPEDKKG